MRNDVWDEFWWNNITGAHAVVSEVATALLSNRNVILRVPSDLPWRYSMRSSIYSVFREKTDSREVVIDPIDVKDDNPDQLSPGLFILNRYASSQVSKGYREKSKISIQDYLAQKKVIRNRVIWVKGLSSDVTNEWIKFCKGFSPQTVTEGLFVVEVHEDQVVNESKYLKCVDYESHVSKYDVQLLNSIILDKNDDYSDKWKTYIASATASLCDIDAEVSEFVLQNTDFYIESPIEGVKKASLFPALELRGRETTNHVLWYVRENKDAELEHRLWSAQVTVLFPIIELKRISLIQEWYAQVENVLQKHEVWQYNNLLKDPMEVELGTLHYLISHRDENGLYLLYIPEEQERDTIHFLHECRNLLAHASCCSPVQIKKLLESV